MAERVAYDDIKAENLTIGTVIVEGRIDPVTGQLKNPSFYRVSWFWQQGHEVRVTVRPLKTPNSRLHWRYEAEARVFIQ